MKLYYMSHLGAEPEVEGANCYSVYTSKSGIKRAIAKETKEVREHIEYWGPTEYYGTYINVLSFTPNKRGIIGLLNHGLPFNQHASSNAGLYGEEPEWLQQTKLDLSIRYTLPDFLKQPSQTSTIEEVVEARAEELRKEGHDVATFILSREDIEGWNDE